jgi:chromosome segregation ATPase
VPSVLRSAAGGRPGGRPNARSLDQLRDQLTSVETARPRRAAALAELDQRATAFRQELRAVETALAGIRAADAQAEADQHRAQAQAFTQGRIDLYFTRLRHAEDDQLARLRERTALAARAVTSLMRATGSV